MDGMGIGLDWIAIDDFRSSLNPAKSKDLTSRLKALNPHDVRIIEKSRWDSGESIGCNDESIGSMYGILHLAYI